MLSNKGNFHTNRSERYIHGGLSLPNGPHNNLIPNNKAANRRMETSIVWKLLTFFGIPAYIGAFLLNITTWKADLLFGLAIAMALIRFGFYCYKTWQIVRMNELEIKEREKKLQKK